MHINGERNKEGADEQVAPTISQQSNKSASRDTRRQVDNRCGTHTHTHLSILVCVVPTQ